MVNQPIKICFFHAKTFSLYFEYLQAFNYNSLFLLHFMHIININYRKTYFLE